MNFKINTRRGRYGPLLSVWIRAFGLWVMADFYWFKFISAWGYKSHFRWVKFGCP